MRREVRATALGCKMGDFKRWEWRWMQVEGPLAHCTVWWSWCWVCGWLVGGLARLCWWVVAGLITLMRCKVVGVLGVGGR